MRNRFCVICFALAAALVVFSCDEEQLELTARLSTRAGGIGVADGMENGETPAMDSAFEQLPEVYLELCYATSINMPEGLYGPENVFDGDTTTCWATMPGAAPDEGIYFSFDEPVGISSISITSVPVSEDYCGIGRVQYYINGQAWWDATGISDPLIMYNIVPVKSVFIKLLSRESVGSDFEDGITHHEDRPIAISEISVEVDGQPVRIVPIARTDGSIAASSSLEPVEAYSPDFLFDSRLAFGWADGNSNSRGAGESITFSFDEPQRIEAFRIWNGYHRSPTHFDHNERASLISFGLQGTEKTEYSLEDNMEAQVFYLAEPLEGNVFEMDILSVYPGLSYLDLVISEMQFFDGARWMTIDTGTNDERKAGVLQWAEGCDAGLFIDRQIRRRRFDSQEYSYSNQSLVIRSNGSFVLWKHDGFVDGDRNSVYADGNWQVLDDRSMRIFGRLHRLTLSNDYYFDPYAGVATNTNANADRVTIFSDTLRFGADWISSSRGLFEDFSF